MAKQIVRLRVNGYGYEVLTEPNRPLLDVVREDLGLSGAKEGCGTGDCGACTMLFDGQPITSCLMLVPDAEGHDVVTVEGIARDGELHPVQKAFIEYGALSCGYCIPGNIISAVALLERTPNPTFDDIRYAISGNLCRCTGYTKIIEAIEAAAQEMALVRR
jgi:aerobic carbon-monoxide dehydrogenase small subunit